MKQKSFSNRIIILGFLFLLLIIAIPFAGIESFSSLSSYVGNYTKWLAIVFGLLATLTTFRYAFQFKGSTLGRIFGFFGFGMFLVVIGGFSPIFLPFPEGMQKIFHDILFAIGYSFMLLGASYIKQLSS